MYGAGQNWVLPFLPYGAELLMTESYPKKTLLQTIDLDHDHFLEVIGIFRLNQKLYLFVLNNFYGHWRVISVVEGTGYQVSYFGVESITSRHAMDIVVGWQIGGIWSKLSIYEWKSNGLKEITKKDYSFSKMEIEDMSGRNGKDGKAEIALWSHDTAEAYKVDVYRWEKGKLIRAKDVEPYYFKKVVQYYQEKIREHPDYLFYYPYLEDAKKKALQETEDTRAIYLFPAAVKEIGGNKWGFIDKNGQYILPPIYDHVGDFQENGLAIVRMMDLTGIIDSHGYFIVKPKYDTINPFSEGRATVIDHQGFKVIDESGKEITAKAYSYIGDYQEGRAIFADTDTHGQYLYGYLNRWGKEVIPQSYESAANFKEGKAIVKMNNDRYDLIELTGKVLRSYSDFFVGNYGEGLLAFQKSRETLFGYINEQGNVVIQPHFSGAEGFNGERAIVSVADDYMNRYGLIDPKGQFIIKPNYNRIIDLGEGRFALGKALDLKKPYIGSKYAVADTDGHILTGFIYNGIAKYEDGAASAYNDQSTFFIDKSGKRIEHLPMISGSGTLAFDRTLLKGEIDFRLYYFDKNGELIWKQNTFIPLNNRFSVMEEKYRPNKDYLVYFPQIKGIGNPINQTLKQLSGVKEVPADKQLASNYIGDFEVAFFKKDLVAIEITGYDYPFGAAHGMPVKKYAHIDLDKSLLYQLKELFKRDSNFVKVISDLINDQIKSNEKYSYVFPNTYTGIKSDQPFFISEGALNIYFEPYEIAPYAAGFPTFTIPFEELSDIIDQQGGFWRAFH